jgi:hypothetical protein
MERSKGNCCIWRVGAKW